MEKDYEFMTKAIELAQKGEGETSPNPLVGAVIVKQDKIIGQGYHTHAGAPHAEILALTAANSTQIKDSILYTNLEPCVHYGKTPPCVDEIIKAKIKKVVIAMVDPNPLVKGRGIKMLKEAGIEVEVGVLQKEAERLNEVYLTYITKKRPFTILKMAMSLDGKIKTAKKWLSCELSRAYVKKIRSIVDGIVVGKITVLADNPRLETPHKQKLYKIILDSKLQINTSFEIFKTPQNIVLATTEAADKDKIKELEDLGVKIYILPATKENMVDIVILWQKLAKELEITSVLLEGGGRLSYSAVKAELVDKVIFFVCPIFVGGKLTALDGPEFNEVLKLKEVKFKKIGSDFIISGYLSY